MSLLLLTFSPFTHCDWSRAEIVNKRADWLSLLVLVGAAMFSLEDFLSGNRLAVTSVPAYWDPQPEPTQDSVPIFYLKISHSTGSRKRKITSYDESWIDSFDPRPSKNRTDPTLLDKMDFATKLKKIDPDAIFEKLIQMSQSNFELLTIS